MDMQRKTLRWGSSNTNRGIEGDKEKPETRLEGIFVAKKEDLLGLHVARIFEKSSFLKLGKQGTRHAPLILLHAT